MQEGYWVKLAEGAYLFSARLQINVLGSSTGAALLEGFPFTFKTSSTDTQAAFVRGYTMLGLAGSVAALPTEGDTICQLFEMISTGSVSLDEGNFQANSLLQFTTVLLTD